MLLEDAIEKAKSIDLEKLEREIEEESNQLARQKFKVSVDVMIFPYDDMHLDICIRRIFLSLDEWHTLLKAAQSARWPHFYCC